MAKTRRISTRKVSRTTTRKAPARRRRPQFKQFDHVAEAIAAPPQQTYIVDFRFFAHVPVEAESLDAAFAKAKDLTVGDAWQSARKYRTEVLGVFTPDHERARTRSADIGRS